MKLIHYDEFHGDEKLPIDYVFHSLNKLFDLVLNKRDD